MDDSIKTAIAVGAGTWLVFNILFNFHMGGPRGAILWAPEEGMSVIRAFVGFLIGAAAGGGTFFVMKK